MAAKHASDRFATESFPGASDVFGEPTGSGAVGIIGGLLAFGLMIAGAALVPAPLRATLGDPARRAGPPVERKSRATLRFRLGIV